MEPDGIRETVLERCVEAGLIAPESREITGALRSLGEGTFTVALSQDAQFALVQWGDERVLICPYSGGKPDVVARGAVAPSWNR
ncbi:MAG TPA: hypothetical protein VFT86_09490 [Gaiellaceae bacterium]|nr:hypothetical protein [Gaiellaceae bacterium]